ncbi:MAG TPA: type II toxin-antitoxin system RelE/ParE family toxin [Candidatus Nanoarchaeia archaeon]|nr:type II toxin-antitoxin system RelE/ParE family toxin [Candidatus Nanoarchaeia archaeon]
MYKIIFEKQPIDFFNKLDKNLQERIGKKIEKLKQNPKEGIPLIGNLAGQWKLRIGDYRIIYKIINEELIILILKIGHRKNIYD